MDIEEFHWDGENFTQDPNVRRKYFNDGNFVDLWEWNNGAYSVLLNSKLIENLILTRREAGFIIEGILNKDNDTHWEPQRQFPRCPCNGKRFCKRINKKYYLEVRKYCDGHILINKVRYSPVHAENLYYGSYRNPNIDDIKETIKMTFFEEGRFLLDEALNSLWKDIENNISE